MHAADFFAAVAKIAHGFQSAAGATPGETDRRDDSMALLGRMHPRTDNRRWVELWRSPCLSGRCVFSSCAAG